MYLCRIYFFTNLDKYKDYFEGRRACIVWPNAKKWHISSFSLKKLLRLFAKGIVTKEIPDLHCWWTEEPYSQHLLQVAGISHVLGSVHHWLVTYWDSCIELEDCHYNTSSIGYWGKSSIVGWYFGIGQKDLVRFPILVTAYDW